MRKWEAKQLDDNTSRIIIPTVRNSKWEQWALVTSCVHIDNPNCNRSYYLSLLKTAVEKNAIICDLGDHFDAMGGMKDPRSGKEDLDPEVNVKDYYRSLVKLSYKRIHPYAKNFAFIGMGNHETSVLRNGEFNLTDALVEKLNAHGASAVYNGHYSGYLQFFFKDKNRWSDSKVLHYHHGTAANKARHMERMASHPDANIIVMGHWHTCTAEKHARSRLTATGKHYQDDVWILRVPSLKDEYKNGKGGYHIERGRSPRPIGAWWLRFVYRDEVVVVQPIPAI